MQQCVHCKKPFGMVRKTVGMLWWMSQFCSEKCMQDHQKERQQLERVSQFLQWLHARTN